MFLRSATVKYGDGETNHRDTEHTEKTGEPRMNADERRFQKEEPPMDTDP
jgi:hypothetical protein